MRTVRVAEARRRLPSLLSELEGKGPVLITRRGRPRAVLVPVEDFERMRREAALLEALEISRAMEDRGGVPDAVTLARESREELEERT